jgi:hypothetical protein
MKRTTKTITESHKHNTLADAALAREHEIFNYQINIDNYTKMLDSLPKGDWPAALVAYKNTPIAQLPINLSDDDALTISDLQLRDRLIGSLRAEKVEQAKSRRVYDAVIAQLPADKAADLISDAVIRRDEADA